MLIDLQILGVSSEMLMPIDLKFKITTNEKGIFCHPIEISSHSMDQNKIVPLTEEKDLLQQPECQKYEKNNSRLDFFKQCFNLAFCFKPSIDTYYVKYVNVDQQVRENINKQNEEKTKKLKLAVDLNDDSEFRHIRRVITLSQNGKSTQIISKPFKDMDDNNLNKIKDQIITETTQFSHQFSKYIYKVHFEKKKKSQNYLFKALFSDKNSYEEIKVVSEIEVVSGTYREVEKNRDHPPLMTVQNVKQLLDNNNNQDNDIGFVD